MYMGAAIMTAPFPFSERGFGSRDSSHVIFMAIFRNSVSGRASRAICEPRMCAACAAEAGHSRLRELLSCARSVGGWTTGKMMRMLTWYVAGQMDC
jgi:hypothetical protein